ncbi:hypothetical protein BDQ12DRAFT_665497 [Crucibulum laeve]|uniref:Uncharacterized protein n=1 Tax=Crucibulum laeve TaxID=68775 RepID=A0A5C3M154_9AGAR|nr:hypothetical protein BDQ12DRAFT_665497 [Crucibulum laeve]
MLTLSNEGAAVSVSDVLEAVRAAIAGRQPAFAPAATMATMAQMGTIRLDERGRLVWSGFQDGSEGVWELSLSFVHPLVRALHNSICGYTFQQIEWVLKILGDARYRRPGEMSTEVVTDSRCIIKRKAVV